LLLCCFVAPFFCLCVSNVCSVVFSLKFCGAFSKFVSYFLNFEKLLEGSCPRLFFFSIFICSSRIMSNLGHVNELQSQVDIFYRKSNIICTGNNAPIGTLSIRYSFFICFFFHYFLILFLQATCCVQTMGLPISESNYPQHLRGGGRRRCQGDRRRSRIRHRCASGDMVGVS